MHTFKYIIKRILIGTGIALALMFIKGNLLYQVHAKDISSVNNPFTTSNINVVNNNTSTSDFDISGGNWANWGLGTLRFNFSIIKVSGSATDPIVIPSGITANSGGSAYACNVSSNSTNNSTWTGNSYTANCNMKMGSSGLTKITIYLTPNQQNTTSTYRITIAPVITYEQDDNTIINVDTSSTTNAINNQTQTITNNQTQNTQDIINNQNSNKEEIKNEIKNELSDGCRNSKNLNNINGTGLFTNGQGVVVSSNSYLYSVIDVTNINNIYVSGNWNLLADSLLRIGLFTSYPNVGTTGIRTGLNSNGSLDVSSYNYVLLSYAPSTSSVTRQDMQNSFMVSDGTSYIAYEPYGQLVCGANKIDKVNDSINSVNNTLNNSDTDSAQQDADSAFLDYEINTHGLTRIITAPIRLFTSMLGGSCSSLSFPLPFVNQNVTLPCMSTIYQQHFGNFLTLYRLITDGIIGYWVAVKVFKKCKDFLDPTNDKIEVFNL